MPAPVTQEDEDSPSISVGVTGWWMTSFRGSPGLMITTARLTHEKEPAELLLTGKNQAAHVFEARGLSGGTLMAMWLFKN